MLERELRLSGFWDNIPARNRLKGELQKVLLSPEMSQALPKEIFRKIFQGHKETITRVMEVAEKNNDVILYAQ
jgi:type I restriction enzyme, R subunit